MVITYWKSLKTLPDNSHNCHLRLQKRLAAYWPEIQRLPYPTAYKTMRSPKPWFLTVIMVITYWKSLKTLPDNSHNCHLRLQKRLAPGRLDCLHTAICCEALNYCYDCYLAMFSMIFDRLWPWWLLKTRVRGSSLRSQHVLTRNAPRVASPDICSRLPRPPYMETIQYVTNSKTYANIKKHAA